MNNNLFQTQYDVTKRSKLKIFYEKKKYLIHNFISIVLISIIVISFHSVEDRIIKHFFKDLVIYKDLSYDIHSQNVNQQLKIITKKPIIESKINIYKNPRARSAKLRVAERIK